MARNFWQQSRLTPYWKGQLLDYFVLGVPAYRLRFKTPYSQPTIERFFRILRLAIYQVSLKEIQVLKGTFELDETLFGGRRKGSKRGWGATGKHMVFGIYKRNGKVLTFPIDGTCLLHFNPLNYPPYETGELVLHRRLVGVHVSANPGQPRGGDEREGCA